MSATESASRPGGPARTVTRLVERLGMAMIYLFVVGFIPMSAAELWHRSV